MGPDCKIARAKFTVEPNLADRGLKATTKSPKSVSVRAMSTTKGAVAKPSQLETIAKSLNGFVEAFRPTTPGHSPGVGHSVNN
ncbi:hypothetical protein GmHk_01G002424 [Glycine max]|nr:hypothetical protein GmHk_01G002424 [Glycine max]